eukprot:7868_1
MNMNANQFLTSLEGIEIYNDVDINKEINEFLMELDSSKSKQKKNDEFAKIKETQIQLNDDITNTKTLLNNLLLENDCEDEDKEIEISDEEDWSDSSDTDIDLYTLDTLKLSRNNTNDSDITNITDISDENMNDNTPTEYIYDYTVSFTSDNIGPIGVLYSNSSINKIKVIDDINDEDDIQYVKAMYSSMDSLGIIGKISYNNYQSLNKTVNIGDEMHDIYEANSDKDSDSDSDEYDEDVNFYWFKSIVEENDVYGRDDWDYYYFEQSDYDTDNNQILFHSDGEDFN